MRVQFDQNDVLLGFWIELISGVAHLDHVIATVDNAFSEQKTIHQIEILSRGAHGDG